MAITHERSRPCQINNTVSTNGDNEGTSLLHGQNLSLVYAGDADYCDCDGQRSKTDRSSSSIIAVGTKFPTEEEERKERKRTKEGMKRTQITQQWKSLTCDQPRG